MTLPRKARLWESRAVHAVIAGAVTLAVVGVHTGDAAEAARPDGFLCDTARAWRAAHPDDIDTLDVVVTDAFFHGTPGEFRAGEGIVVAAAAFAFEGFQEVVDVQTSPPAAKLLRVDGHTVAVWPYPAILHRDLRYVAVSLVRRTTPERPHGLPEEMRLDASSTAADSDEHDLGRCKAWNGWAAKVALGATALDRVTAILRAVSPRPAEEVPRGRAHDVCAALRESSFSEHHAQVLAVMAARELGIPAYGLVAASGALLVGVFVDERWQWLDLAGRPVSLPPLVSRAPVAGRFEAASDGFWLPNAGAFQSSMGQIVPTSGTQWRVEGRNVAPGKDTTTTRSIPLREVCR